MTLIADPHQRVRFLLDHFESLIVTVTGKPVTSSSCLPG